ncbi:hypothetical protein AB6C67_15975 [Vibrio cyclitrophicus]
MNYVACSQSCSDSIIAVKECGSSFHVKNKNRGPITKLKVDGCLIQDHRERCDWILYQDAPSKKAMYVELKGCDVLKGISQLESTLIHTKAQFSEYKKECYIVSSRVPKHSTSLARRKMKFNKDTQSILIIKNVKCEVTF